MNARARPYAILSATVFFVYAYFYQAGGWNQNSRFDLTRAIVERGTFVIDAYHDNTGDKAKRLGHFYSDKAPGVSMLAVPVWAAVYLAAGAPPYPAEKTLATGAYLSTVLAVALPSTLAVLALFWLLGQFGVGEQRRAIATLGYAFGTLAFPYSTAFYGHQTAAAFALLGFAALLYVKCGGSPKRGLFAAGLLLGLSVGVEYPSVLLVLVLMGYSLTWLSPRRRIVWLMLGGLIPVLLLAGYHAAAFGKPWALPYDFSTLPDRSMGGFMGLGPPDLRALFHLTISPFRGVLFSAPWLLFALPGARRFWSWRNGKYRSEVSVCIACALLFMWMNASLVDWPGGWAMGPRYLVPALPFLAILASGSFLPGNEPSTRKGTWSFAVGVMLALSFLYMLIGTSVNLQVPLDIRNPFGTYLAPAFVHGDLSKNMHSMSSAEELKHGPRQAWNLGQAAGLPRLFSLLPLVFHLTVGTWLLLSPRAFSHRKGVRA